MAQSLRLRRWPRSPQGLGVRPSRPTRNAWANKQDATGDDARWRNKLKNGAKRIRTADPLHAMQVLYQLSYGPIRIDPQLECWRFRLARGPRCRWQKLTPQRVPPPHTWRQTATSRPWIVT